MVKKFLNPKSCYYSFTKNVQANKNLSFVNINYAYILYSFPSWAVLSVLSLFLHLTYLKNKPTVCCNVTSCNMV